MVGIRKWVEMDVANIVEYKMCIISRMYIYIWYCYRDLSRAHGTVQSQTLSSMAEAKVQKWRTRFCQFRCNLSNAQQFSWGYGAKSGSGSYFCNFVHSCPLQCHNVACLDASLDLMLVILQANPCSFWSDLQPEQGQAPKSRGFTEFVCQRIGVPSWQHSTSTSCCLATPGLAPEWKKKFTHPPWICRIWGDLFSCPLKKVRPEDSASVSMKLQEFRCKKVDKWNDTEQTGYKQDKIRLRKVEKKGDGLGQGGIPARNWTSFCHGVLDPPNARVIRRLGADRSNETSHVEDLYNFPCFAGCWFSKSRYATLCVKEGRQKHTEKLLRNSQCVTLIGFLSLLLHDWHDSFWYIVFKLMISSISSCLLGKSTSVNQWKEVIRFFVKQELLLRSASDTKW